MQYTFAKVRELEETMDRLGTAAHSLCDGETNRKVANLRFLIAEMRVLAANPRDPEAIDRFTALFAETN